jgi:hypothetical protein
VDDTLWTNHQRIHQYRRGHEESWGGVTIDVDSDVLDGAVVSATGSAAPPAPVAPSQPTTPPGSASTDDGQATATWPANALAADADVGLSGSVPGLTLPGYGTGGYSVTLDVTAMNTLAPVKTFAGPVTLRFAPRASRLAPVYSTDGTVWRNVPPLAGDLLAPGAETGYTHASDGGFVIQTTVAGSFALVPDRIPPAAPANVTARFVGGELALAWQPSTDANGPIAGYRVTLANRPVDAVAPNERGDRVTGFARGGPSVYRVVAVDAAGNESEPSTPVVVLPSARPTELPAAIPGWAWRLFGWRAAGRQGARPKAPRVVPGWYWGWAAWRAVPFHLRASA